jgi:hypothetical protein
VTATFDLLRDYFAAVRPEGDPDLSIADLMADAEHFATAASPDTARLLRDLPEIAPEVVSVRVLSGVGYGLIRALSLDPSVLGSLMRRKLASVIAPIEAHLSRLTGS